MKYIIMLGNEEFLTAFDPDATGVQVLSDTNQEAAQPFTSQDSAVEMLEEVRAFYHGDPGVRIVLDV
ncbi:hypothetical protein HCJ66_11375 [Listeria sp. FSL L7-1582]|uniref:hypothetical protein n=1 Tax=Listeria portnoyi TaxID=2713504 RepID=UPI00164ED17C|nr:hypothetical protein [Listeria portnoyi]MBC6310138.1 hypothetical protein [Listeria portnoyi]